MTKKINFKIGQRDIDILFSFDRTPLTAQQLCDLSTTFEKPFTDLDNLRRRLRTLEKAGLIKSFPYAIASIGRTPSYHKLTRDGYAMLYGESAAKPKRRYFLPISPGHHHHTNCLAQLLVHLCLKAQQNDCRVLHFARENSFRLVAEPFTLYPDCAFVIERSDGRRFSFCVEFDNGTERVRSKQNVESIERKVRGYDAHQSKFAAHDPDRYIVLFITTRSELRLQHILRAASEIMGEKKRTVFTGCTLKEFLACDPFHVAVFENHFGLRRTVIPMIQHSMPKQAQQKTNPLLATA